MALAAQSPSSVPKPGPEQKRLEVFLGRWNVDGEAQASPYGPAGKLTSIDTWAWMPGGFFMTHHWDSKQGGVEIKGMEVLGYDGRSKVYTSRFFDNLGNSGPWKGTVQGNAWTWTGDTEVAGKPLKERCTTIVAGRRCAHVQVRVLDRWSQVASQFRVEIHTWQVNVAHQFLAESIDRLSLRATRFAIALYEA